MPLAFLLSLPLALLTTSEVLSYGADMSRYVTWYVGEMPWNANLFQWEFPACWNRMSWKQSAGHRQREAARRMRERQIGKHIESCTLSGALEALLQMTLIGAVRCKASDIIAEGALSIASQSSIGLVDIKWGTFIRSRYKQICHLICRRNAMKCQLVPVRIPNLFQWEFPACWNRMSWTESAGHRYREAARCMRERQIGKQTESCTLAALQARSEEHLKHSCRWHLLEQLLFVAKHLTLWQKMPLALLVSFPLALLTSSEVLSCVHGADMSRYVTWYVGEMPWNANLFQWEFPTCSSENSQLVGTECLESSLQDTDIESFLKP